MNAITFSEPETHLMSWRKSFRLKNGWVSFSGDKKFISDATFVFEKPGPDFGDGPLCQDLSKQIKNYLDGEKYHFDFPMAFEVTPFRKKVLQALREIPAGQTRTYGQLAKQLGSSARAVGGACRNNPLVLLIPCHRVVAAQGLGGFAGQTDGPYLKLKKSLLLHEGALNG